MPNSARTSVHSHSEQIKVIFGKANALAALLSVYDILPPVDAASSLETCAGLADQVSAELAALIGGAA